MKRFQVEIIVHAQQDKCALHTSSAFSDGFIALGAVVFQEVFEVLFPEFSLFLLVIEQLGLFFLCLGVLKSDATVLQFGNSPAQKGNCNQCNENV